MVALNTRPESRHQSRNHSLLRVQRHSTWNKPIPEVTTNHIDQVASQWLRVQSPLDEYHNIQLFEPAQLDYQNGWYITGILSLTDVDGDYFNRQELLPFIIPVEFYLNCQEELEAAFWQKINTPIKEGDYEF